jgi:hypothetical protein
VSIERQISNASITDSLEQSKVSQESTTPKKVKQAQASQVSSQQNTVSPSKASKGKGPQHPEALKQTDSEPAASTSGENPQSETQNAVNFQLSAGNKNVTENARSETQSDLTPSSLDKRKASASNPQTTIRVPLEVQKIKTDPILTTTTNYDEEIFRLAAATPVPISNTIERQFFESQLLLYVLENIRGEHQKRQNYHGELDQGETELRRSLVDKLAYICDFKKGGPTVTAIALQKTNQGVVFWLAANETVKAKVIAFLRQVLKLLKQVELRASRKTTETQLLGMIVPFNKERIDYYWNALSRELSICITRLEALEKSTSKLLSLISSMNVILRNPLL